LRSSFYNCGVKKRYRTKEIVVFRRKKSSKHTRQKPSYATVWEIIFVLFIGFLISYLISAPQFKEDRMLSVNPFSPRWQKLLHPASKKPLVQTQTAVGSNTIVWHGPRDKKEVALTFDADITPIMVDWLHSGQVATYDDTRITDYLIQHQIKATFFMTGLWIELYPKETQTLAASNLFEFEDHSYSHPSMAGYCFDQPQIPQSQYPFEIEKTQQLIEQYTHQTPKYFRFPGGCYDQADLDLVKKEGLTTVHWDAVADDGFNDNESEIINNVLSETQSGSIIVMHMGSPDSNVPQTANALPTIITTLQKEGYTFVTVNDLLTQPKAIAQTLSKEDLASLESFQRLSL